MIDIIVIGGGTAGMSAAIYAVRAGKSVLILEGYACGGQIVVSPEVENYPGIKHISGFEFADALMKQAESLGAEIQYKNVTSLKVDGDVKTVTTEDGESICAKAVIIATGLKKRLLGIPREEELTGNGISYCATCDGAFFKGKVTAVNGGGNTALEDAIFLTEYCKKVYLIHRRSSFRAENALVKTLQNKPNVEFVLDSVITELHGEGALTGITVKNNNTGEKKDIELQGLFVAVGQNPQNEIFTGLIDIDEYGYIKADESCLTNVEGVFVAGDCRTKKVRQLVTAASDGATAAIAACNYLEAL